MAEGVDAESETSVQELVEESNKRAFLKSSELADQIVEGMNMVGFQLGGGAVDFVLEKYRRPHGDVDMVYVVNSKKWKAYLKDPKAIPDERVSMQKVNQEPELYSVEETTSLGMDLMGAPGVQMKGGELPLVVDFIEAYKHTENGEEYIMLPIYEGASFIKIPSSEVVEKTIDGVKTKVPSVEVQFLLKEQAASMARTLKGGPLPDRREKSQLDRKELEEVADMSKVKALREKGVGFNFSPRALIRFGTTQLFRSLVGR